MLRKLLLQVAKGPYMGGAVGYAFRYFSWIIPVRKVYRSKEVIVFCHPKPSYANHLVLSPKRAVRNLMHMASGDLCKYFLAIWQASQAIGTMKAEYREGFTLVANGGRKQEVQQVHFHMFSDHWMVEEHVVEELQENIIFQDSFLLVLEHPEPDLELHFVVKPAMSLCKMKNEKGLSDYLSGLLNCINSLENHYGIVAKGYSLVYQYRKQAKYEGYPVFHIVAGKRRMAQQKQ